MTHVWGCGFHDALVGTYRHCVFYEARSETSRQFNSIELDSYGKTLVCDFPSSDSTEYSDDIFHCLSDTGQRTRQYSKKATMDPLLRKFIGSDEWNDMVERKRYGCSQCDAQFKKLCEVSVHVKNTHWKLRCEFCRQPFKDEATLQRHHEKYHSHECSLCDDIFPTKLKRLRHVQRDHKKPKPPRRKPTKTHFCHCGKAFSRKAYLQTHQRTHEDVRPFECETCGRRFVDRTNLRRHHRTHTRVKNFKCGTCGRSFARKDGLRSHLKIHGGPLAYSCRYCGKKFRHQTNAHRHEKNLH